MIYHLARYLQKSYSFFNLFHYISFRSISCLLSSFFLSLLFGNWFIKKITGEKQFHSKPRERTPKNHLKKSVVPTMGGLLILTTFTINFLFWNNLLKPSSWLILVCLLFFGMIGFLDDWFKINKGKGIQAKTKFFMQILVAGGLMTLWFLFCANTTKLCIPFFKNLMPELGWMIIPWGMFVIVGTSNAVNLADGLDGLATGPLIINFAVFALLCNLAGHKVIASYLQIPFAASAELTLICCCIIGCLLGFLWYNAYPAQVFMGDVGSLALGATLGFIAIICRQEIPLSISGGIFVVEALSVIAQVGSYKIIGRRIFKMAPIHHHFELLGWNEAKITVRFWIISVILALLSLLT